jgi:hypothetical protein
MALTYDELIAWAEEALAIERERAKLGGMHTAHAVARLFRR